MQDSRHAVSAQAGPDVRSVQRSLLLVAREPSHKHFEELLQACDLAFRLISKTALEGQERDKASEGEVSQEQKKTCFNETTQAWLKKTVLPELKFSRQFSESFIKLLDCFASSRRYNASEDRVILRRSQYVDLLQKAFLPGLLQEEYSALFVEEREIEPILATVEKAQYKFQNEDELTLLYTEPGRTIIELRALLDNYLSKFHRDLKPIVDSLDPEVREAFTDQLGSDYLPAVLWRTAPRRLVSQEINRKHKKLKQPWENLLAVANVIYGWQSCLTLLPASTVDSAHRAACSKFFENFSRDDAGQATVKNYNKPAPSTSVVSLLFSRSSKPSPVSSEGSDLLRAIGAVNGSYQVHEKEQTLRREHSVFNSPEVRESFSGKIKRCLANFRNSPNEKAYHELIENLSLVVRHQHHGQSDKEAILAVSVEYFKTLLDGFFDSMEANQIYDLLYHLGLFKLVHRDFWSDAEEQGAADTHNSVLVGAIKELFLADEIKRREEQLGRALDREQETALEKEIREKQYDELDGPESFVRNEHHLRNESVESYMQRRESIRDLLSHTHESLVRAVSGHRKFLIDVCNDVVRSLPNTNGYVQGNDTDWKKIYENAELVAVIGKRSPSILHELTTVDNWIQALQTKIQKGGGKHAWFESLPVHVTLVKFYNLFKETCTDKASEEMNRFCCVVSTIIDPVRSGLIEDDASTAAHSPGKRAAHF